MVCVLLDARDECRFIKDLVGWREDGLELRDFVVYSLVVAST